MKIHKNRSQSTADSLFWFIRLNSEFHKSAHGSDQISKDVGLKYENSCELVSISQKKRFAFTVYFFSLFLTFSIQLSKQYKIHFHSQNTFSFRINFLIHIQFYCYSAKDMYHANQIETLLLCRRELSTYLPNPLSFLLVLLSS